MAAHKAFLSSLNPTSCLDMATKVLLKCLAWHGAWNAACLLALHAEAVDDQRRRLIMILGLCFLTNHEIILRHMCGCDHVQEFNAVCVIVYKRHSPYYLTMLA